MDPVRTDVEERAELTDGRVNAAIAQDPDTDALATKPATVRLDVVAPPPVDRVDDKQSRADGLANAGIETVSELSLATPAAIRVLTDAYQDMAEIIRDRASGYANAYALTRFEQIGSAEAEALWEARRWSYYGSLPSLEEYGALLEELDDEVSEGVLEPKYLNEIEEMDWQAVRASISRLEGE